MKFKDMSEWRIRGAWCVPAWVCELIVVAMLAAGVVGKIFGIPIVP